MVSLLTLLVLAAPLDFPPSTDMCDAQGWFIPIPGWEPGSFAGDGVALVIASEAGYLAVFFDNQWRSAHRMPEGTKVVQVQQTDLGVRLLACVKRSCSWRTWRDGALSEPEAAVVNEPPATGRARSGTLANGTEWKRVHGSLMLKTEQGWQRDATCSSPTVRVDAFSAGPRPFWSCWQYGAGSLAHFDGKRIVTVHDVWATHWAPLDLFAFEERAGCAPCSRGTAIPGSQRPTLVSGHLDSNRIVVKARACLCTG